MTAVLPVLLSVPHAGLRVPEEVESLCTLTPDQIAEDGDEHAREIYDLAASVAHYVTTDIARAIVDLNRRDDDRRPDGVVKTHTCFNLPVYHRPLTDTEVETLLARYYRPYHARLGALAHRDVSLGVDCHTMLAVGPPIGPGAGIARPRVCLGNGDGTCPPAWMTLLTQCFEETFGHDVSVNAPFAGGHITRSHASEMPWVQVELSRAPFATNAEKRQAVLAALQQWVEQVDHGPA